MSDFDTPKSCLGLFDGFLTKILTLFQKFQIATVNSIDSLHENSHFLKTHQIPLRKKEHVFITHFLSIRGRRGISCRYAACCVNARSKLLKNTNSEVNLKYFYWCFPQGNLQIYKVLFSHFLVKNSKSASNLQDVSYRVNKRNALISNSFDYFNENTAKKIRVNCSNKI